MRRRLTDWELPQVPPDVLGAGQGALEVPYDQTAEEVPDVSPLRPEEELPPEDTTAIQPGGTEESGDPGMLVDEGMGDAGGLLGAMGGAEAGPDSSMLSDEDLSGMVGEEDETADEMIAALEDPNTPPELKQQIEMQLAMAARRRMAGITGGGF